MEAGMRGFLSNLAKTRKTLQLIADLARFNFAA
jgi:hypothetical protein